MKMNFVPNRNAIFSSVLYGFAVSIAKDYDYSVDVVWEYMLEMVI